MENYSYKYGILGETENGIQSEFVVLKAENIHLMPEHLSFEEAASMQLVFMTSYQMLIKRAKLKQPHLSAVAFYDDSFLALRYEILQEFCELYKKEINIPFVPKSICSIFC